jgi:hypothetical protein
MDETRFDDLIRILSGGRTRRGLGRLLGGLLLGSTLASPLDPTQAKKKNNDNDKKKSCPSCKKKKDGKCKENKPAGTACENGGTCQSGSCIPPSGASDVAPPPPPPGTAVDTCPQRKCCACLTNGVPTSCSLVASDQRCNCPLGGQGQGIINWGPMPGTANFCATDNTCTRLKCPVA